MKVSNNFDDNTSYQSEQQNYSNNSYETQGYQQEYNQGYGQEYGQGYGQGYQQNYSQDYNQGYQQDYQQQQYNNNYNKAVAINILSIVSLAVSVLSIICCGPILAIPALVCAIIVKVYNRYDRRATTAIIISIISIIIYIVLFFIGILPFSMKVNNTDLPIYNTESPDNNITDNNIIDDIINNTEEDTNNDNSSNKYESSGQIGEGEDIVYDLDYKHITINNIKINIDEMTPSDIESALGIKFSQFDLDYEVESNFTSYVDFISDNNVIITFTFINNYDYTVQTRDCTLNQISIKCINDETDIIDNYYNINTGSGITSKSSIQDITNILGEPDDTYVDDTGNNIYTYYKDDTYNEYIEFEFNSTGISKLTIGNM